ncbi:hypothetical protein CsSME_00006387 [Camellia sinensis var. sinensis]
MVSVHNKCEVLGKCYSNISHVYKSMHKYLSSGADNSWN